MRSEFEIRWYFQKLGGLVLLLILLVILLHIHILTYFSIAPVCLICTTYVSFTRSSFHDSTTLHAIY